MVWVLPVLAVVETSFGNHFPFGDNPKGVPLELAGGEDADRGRSSAGADWLFGHQLIGDHVSDVQAGGL